MPPEFWDAAWKVGIPFVLVVSAVIGLLTGKVVVARWSYDAMVLVKDKQFVDMVAEKQEQYRRLEDHYAELWEMHKVQTGVSASALRVVQRRPPSQPTRRT